MAKNIGKKAEDKIKEWLNRPDRGYSLERFYDQMTGFAITSRNICDFICYKYPNAYYIESKATSKDRFDFTMIQPHQLDGLCEKSKIKGCYGWIFVLFSEHKRAFIFNASDIKKLSDKGIKSLNILKVNSWKIPYKEIKTIPNNRKLLLDYLGEIEDYIIGK